MTSKTDDKLKTALDESRLLILGAQVLFGFTFEGIFQDLFKEVAPSGQIIQCAALAMLLLRIGCLIAPSLHHQIASGGDSRSASLQVATVFASMSLLPITLGLGAAVYVVFDRMFGNTIAGATAGTLLDSTRIALWLRSRIAPQRGQYARGEIANTAENKNRAIADRSTRDDSWWASIARLPVHRDAYEGFFGIATNDPVSARTWFDCRLSRGHASYDALSISQSCLPG